MRARGQMFSGELMIAYVVFTIVLILVVYLWGGTIADILESEDISDIEGTAVDVSENLVRTSGIPENWTRSNVRTIGLSNTSRYLNENKVLDFLYLMNSTLQNNSCSGGISNYECNKHLTGIGVYDFYFAMEYLNSTPISINERECATGLQPSEETKKVTMTRTGLLNTTIVRVRLTVWR